MVVCCELFSGAACKPLWRRNQFARNPCTNHGVFGGLLFCTINPCATVGPELGGDWIACLSETCRLSAAPAHYPETTRSSSRRCYLPPRPSSASHFDLRRYYRAPTYPLAIC